MGRPKHARWNFFVKENNQGSVYVVGNIYWVKCKQCKDAFDEGRATEPPRPIRGRNEQMDYHLLECPFTPKDLITWSTKDKSCVSTKKRRVSGGSATATGTTIHVPIDGAMPSTILSPSQAPMAQGTMGVASALPIHQQSSHSVLAAGPLGHTSSCIGGTGGSIASSFTPNPVGNTGVPGNHFASTGFSEGKPKNTTSFLTQQQASSQTLQNHDAFTIVHCWSAPRSRSTALMYSFEARSDCRVLDEPLYRRWLERTGPSVTRPYKDLLIGRVKKATQEEQLSSTPTGGSNDEQPSEQGSVCPTDRWSREKTGLRLRINAAMRDLQSQNSKTISRNVDKSSTAATPARGGVIFVKHMAKHATLYDFEIEEEIGRSPNSNLSPKSQQARDENLDGSESSRTNDTGENKETKPDDSREGNVKVEEEEQMDKTLDVEGTQEMEKEMEEEDINIKEESKEEHSETMKSDKETKNTETTSTSEDSKANDNQEQENSETTKELEEEDITMKDVDNNDRTNPEDNETKTDRRTSDNESRLSSEAESSPTVDVELKEKVDGMSKAKSVKGQQKGETGDAASKDKEEVVSASEQTDDSHKPSTGSNDSSDYHGPQVPQQPPGLPRIKHVHVLLVRDPVAVISSWKAASDNHGNNVTADEIGIITLLSIYSSIESATKSDKNRRKTTKTCPVVVLESDGLVRDARGTLMALCHDLEIPYTDQMLSWESGKHKCDGPWADWWYGDVHKTSGWRTEGKGRAEDGSNDLEYRYRTVDREYLPALRASLPAYQFLKSLECTRNSRRVVGPGGLGDINAMTLYEDERNADLLVWVGSRTNGQLVPRDMAGVSPFDSSVQGGDAVWEGLRVYCGKILSLDKHLRRLFRSARALAFQNVHTHEEITDALFRTLAANGMRDNAHVRLTLTRGEKCTSSMNPKFNVYGTTLIILAEWKPTQGATTYDNKKGISLITAANRRNPPSTVDSKIHHNNMINNILPKIQANLAGAADAIMLDLDGYVSETNATNIFMVDEEGVLRTPHADHCLPGFTREAVLILAKELGIPHEVRRISLAEFHAAEEVFTTGTMGELTPVNTIDGRTIGKGSIGPITKKLQEAYSLLPNRLGWSTRIPPFS